MQNEVGYKTHMPKRNHSILHTLFLLIFFLYTASPLLYRCGYKDFFVDIDASVNPVRELYSLTAKDDGIEPPSLSNYLYHRQESVTFSNRINGFRLFFADLIISKLSMKDTGDKPSKPITILLKKKRCTLSTGQTDTSKHPVKGAITVSGSITDYKTPFMIMAHIDAPKFKEGFSLSHSGLSPPTAYL